MRRLPVPVADSRGLLVERVPRPCLDAARGLVAHGASPERIDAAPERFGTRRGPFAPMAAPGRDVPRGQADRADPAEGAITLTFILALVNAAAQALDDGAALRPGDIDVALVEATGFPARPGDPQRSGRSEQS